MAYDDPDLASSMKAIREQIVRNGGGGIQSLTRGFRTTARTLGRDPADQRIDLRSGLPELLSNLKVSLSPGELERSVKALDRDGNGSLDVEEFLSCLAPPMNITRNQAVDRAFDRIDKDKDGLISKTDIAKLATDDPRYNNLCRMCDRNGDGVIDREEFHNYYREISGSIERDEAFLQLLQRSWRDLR
jgi:Ca2+-binding EF-hand superfamily protein